MRKPCWITGAALLLTFLTLNAATLELKDGSRLQGDLQKIHEGKVYFNTGFAGVLEIPLEEVSGIDSAEAVSLRTESGEVFQGPVRTTRPGTVVVDSAAGSASAEIDAVASGWATGQEDPIVVAQRRNWSYLAAADVSGAEGNSENFNASLRAEAKLEGPRDRLLFYGSYKYQETGSVKSEDEQKGGVRYTNFFTDHLGWFVRQEIERDVFEGIDFRSTTAGGLTRKFVTEEHFTLEGSAGVSYRYESYADDAQEDEGFPGLDFALNMNWRFADWGRLTTSLSYLPSVDDFADYLLEHESAINLPLDSADNWIARFGMRNQYNSNPGPGREDLDTTYFAGLLLTWE